MIGILTSHPASVLKYLNLLLGRQLSVFERQFTSHRSSIHIESEGCKDTTYPEMSFHGQICIS